MVIIFNQLWKHMAAIKYTNKCLQISVLNQGLVGTYITYPKGYLSDIINLFGTISNKAYNLCNRRNVFIGDLSKVHLWSFEVKFLLITYSYQNKFLRRPRQATAPPFSENSAPLDQPPLPRKKPGSALDV